MRAAARAAPCEPRGVLVEMSGDSCVTDPGGRGGKEFDPGGGLAALWLARRTPSEGKRPSSPVGIVVMD